MKILFIGGTGTLSKDTVMLAAKNSDEVFLFNRGNSNSRITLKNVNYIKGDIYDFENSKKSLDSYNFDVVVDYLVFNIESLKQRIKLFQNKTKQYIYISSATIFPSSDKVIVETNKRGNDEWIYSKRKLECELYLEDNKENLGFNYTIVRPYLTYDNRRIPFPIISKISCWNLLDRIERQLPIIMCGDGEQKITVTSTKDFAEAMYSLFLNKLSYNNDFNLVGDTVITWNDIIKILEDCMGRKVKTVYVDSEKIVNNIASQREEILFDKGKTHIFDNSKIKQVVPSFGADRDVNEEIKNTVQYLMDTKEMHKYDKKWNIAENIICNKYGIYEKCNVSVKDRVINWYYDSIFMYNMRKIWHRLFS